MAELPKKLIEIGREHLGFAADKYLKRQCKIHMDKKLDELEKEDLEELGRWVKNTAPLITDQETAEELKEEIISLRE